MDDHPTIDAQAADQGATPTGGVDRRPRLRIGAIASDSARIWRRDLRSLTILATALEAPLLFAEIVLHITPGLKTLVDDSFTLTRTAVVVFLYGALSHHFLAGLLERVVASERQGHRAPTIREILRSLPWHRLLLADLTLTALVVAGLALFVIPGLVAITWFAVTLPIVNLERATVLASFRRSRQLVRGHAWPVFIVAMSALVVPELVAGLCTTLVHRYTDDVILTAISHAIPAIVLMPIAALPIVIMAFELVDLHRTRRPPHQR